MRSLSHSSRLCLNRMKRYRFVDLTLSLIPDLEISLINTYVLTTIDTIFVNGITNIRIKSKIILYKNLSNYKCKALTIHSYILIARGVDCNALCV